MLTIQGRLRPLHLLFLVVLLAIPLALLPLPYVAGGMLVVGFFLLALIDPIWAVYAAILSVPIQELVQLPGGLSVTQATLLLAIVTLALHTLAKPDRPLFLGSLFPTLALLLLALFAASIFTPYSRAEALRETLRWSTVPLIYLLTLEGIGNQQPATAHKPVAYCRLPISSWKLIGLLFCLLIAPAINASVGIVQFWYGLGPESFGIGGGRVRAYGTIGQPNSFAGYMNQAWPLALSLTVCALIWLWRGGPRRHGLALLLALATLSGLLLGGLLTSFSRGGWLGAAGGAAAMAMISIPFLPAGSRRLAWRVIGLGVTGLTLIFALGGGGLLPSALSSRISSIVGNLRIFDVRGVMINPENFAVVERMAHIQASWNMFVQHPLTGVGPGNYSIAFEQTPSSGELPITTRPWYTSRGHAHNYYLHIAAEAGIFGALAYLLLLGAVARQATRTLRYANGLLWQGVAIGCAGVSAALAVHNLFENLHVLNMGLQLGTIWALLVAAERVSIERRSQL
jgi:O-antigen ligase